MSKNMTIKESARHLLYLISEAPIVGPIPHLADLYVKIVEGELQKQRADMRELAANLAVKDDVPWWLANEIRNLK